MIRTIRHLLNMLRPGALERAYAVQEMYLDNFYFTRRRSRNCWWR